MLPEGITHTVAARVCDTVVGHWVAPPGHALPKFHETLTCSSRVVKPLFQARRHALKSRAQFKFKRWTIAKRS